MSFLEELESNKNKEDKNNTEKSPRQLWESCFKYFKHFVSILQKDTNGFDNQFNLSLLNITTESKIIGPFEIKRNQDNNDLRLEVTMITQLVKTIKIKRKDERSAELLRNKLLKDHILSSVKSDNNNNYYTELNQNIPSAFRIILKNEKDFYVEYKNLSLSVFRSIKLPIEKVNQEYMDELAKYILGKNPDLYTESISQKEISKIRDKIALEKELKSKRQQKQKAILEEERRQEEIRKANTVKEKSKRFIINKSKDLKNKILDKINKIKS